MEENRRYDRIRVKYSASFLGHSYSAPGLVIGLSLIGCRALVSFFINPEENLRLLIYVPEMKEPLYIAQAEVRWSEGQEVGMEFTRLAWGDRQRLSELIRTIEGTPERPPEGDLNEG